jgi:hypothetical protein
MLYDILLISKYVFSIFGLSILTSYSICSLTNTPFFNPKSSSKEIVSTLIDSATNLSILGTEVIISAVFYHSYLDNISHSLIQTCLNIIKYSLWIEIFYYGYHRLLHTSRFYLIIHSQHHKHQHVYPIDTININWLDSTGMVATLIAPIWLVKVNLLEYNIIMYIYLTGAFLTHSRLISNRHSIHHEKYKCNYCFLFPIFDYLFGTLVVEGTPGSP